MLYNLTVVQSTKMLKNLAAMLEKGASFAESKKVDVEVLLNSRLAVDQFNLIRQVQIACDSAKLGVARLLGQSESAPKHEDNETTLPELLDRINSVVNYLTQFKAEDFVNSPQISITQPRWDGKCMSGHDYAIEYIIPNVYFHVTTAYSILRHYGVNVGKKDYLGALSFTE